MKGLRPRGFPAPVADIPKSCRFHRSLRQITGSQLVSWMDGKFGFMLLGWILSVNLPFYLCDSEMMHHRGFPTCCSSWTLRSNSLGLSNLDMHLLAAYWDEMGDRKIHLRMNVRSGMWPVHHFPHGLLNCKKPWVLNPWKLTWNLKIINFKKKIIFQTAILGFHVHFPGCHLVCSWLV